MAGGTIGDFGVSVLASAGVSVFVGSGISGSFQTVLVPDVRACTATGITPFMNRKNPDPGTATLGGNAPTLVRTWL